jgi:hypothetical protein
LLLFVKHKRITRVYVKWTIKMSVEALAEVSDLHTWNPNAATYQEFYALYGAARESAAILLNRVVYFDEISDRSVHLIVSQQRGSGGFMTAVSGSQRPEYRVHYDPRETFIALTDGETISTYHTRSVQGIYVGHINKAYKPAHEYLQVNFMSRPGGEEGKLGFNLSSGRGSLSLGERALGWVLGREESARLRYEALPKAIPTSIDHTAIAA